MHFQKDVQFFWAHLKIRLFKHKKFSKSQKKYGVLAHYPDYTQSPIISTSLKSTDAELLGKFKHRALGSSNLSTTSKNLSTTRAQIFKAKNRVFLPFLICTYLSLVFIYFQCLL